MSYFNDDNPDSARQPSVSENHVRSDWPACPRVVIVGAGHRDEICAAVAALEAELKARSDAELVAVDLERTLDLSGVRADLLIVFGGDGHLVSVARRMHDNQIPVVGVNFGKFGFLAEYEYEEFLEDLDKKLLRGDFRIRRRLLIGARVIRHGNVVFDSYALNELLVSRPHLSRILQLEVWVYDQYCTRYHVDGLLVATPAGSTAHSLSAGGPIMSPGMEAYVITPICPHTLTVRPLVVKAGPPIRISIAPNTGEGLLTIDGQDNFALLNGDELIAYRPPTVFQLIKSGRRNFFETLRTKLNWAGHGNIKHS